MFRAILLGACLLFSVVAQAKEYGEGQRYDAGDRVEVSGIGLSFAIPTKWLAALLDGAFVVGSETEAGMLVVIPNMSQSPQEVNSWFRESWPIDETTTFAPKAEAVIEDGRVRVEYRALVNGAEDPSLFGLVQGRIGPNGQYIGVVALGQTSDKENIIGRQEEILSSVQFFPLRRPPELLGCWLNTDGWVSDGFSSMTATKIILDGSGRFNHSVKSSASYSGSDSMGNWTGDTGVESGDGDRGVYYTIATTLFLVEPDGEYRELKFEAANGGMYFNSTKYTRCS